MASVKDRIFTRTGRRRHAPRHYIDLRDLGAGQPALIPPGSRRATTDEDVAVELAKRALKEALDDQKRKASGGVQQVRRLEEFAKFHIEEKERAGKVVESTIARYRNSLLDVACDFFGPERRLDSIEPVDVKDYVGWLAERPNGRGGTLAASTQRRMLAELSNMFKRAVFERAVRYNPVSSLLPEYRPEIERTEADFLDAHEVAILLEAARVRESEANGANPDLFEILATFALTGGRKAEVLGLRVEDVKFDRGVVRIEPNDRRRLKNAGSRRDVPLWPQLREILRDYLFGRQEPLEDLLFPSPTGGMIRDLRKQLDSVGDLAGFEEGRIRTRLLRHSYAVARLQTLDNGAPVSPFVVARELGHADTSMVEKTYGHVGDVRHRSEVVEFRADQHAGVLGDRLERVHAAS